MSNPFDEAIKTRNAVDMRMELDKQIVKSFVPQPMISTGNMEIQLPNLSGVKREALNTSSVNFLTSESDPDFVLLSGSLPYLPTNLSGSLGNLYIPVSLSGSWNSHLTTITNPHGSTLLQTNASFSGSLSGSIGNFSSILSGSRFIATGDVSTSGSAYLANVIYDTNVTPPTASNYTIGTIYVQYTA